MNKDKKTQLNIAKEWTPFLRGYSLFYKCFFQSLLLKKNKNKKTRFLEIGPGEERISEFETVNIVKTSTTDYISDITQKLPFEDGSFDVIYASHVLEHTPWYFLEDTLREWVRVLKKGGVLEVWVPDGLKIAKAFCDAELDINKDFEKDGWYRFNEEKDSCVWFCGRIFSYGDGQGTRGHFNFHLSSFSERFLKKVMKKSGLSEIKRMDPSECRGYDHGWINMGIKGIKK